MDVDVAGCLPGSGQGNWKKAEENTQERKGTEGGAGGGTEQPFLYPRVSASCLKKRRQQEELSRRQKDKGEGRRGQQDAPKSLPLILLLSLWRRICMRLLNQLLLNIYFSTVHFSRGALGRPEERVGQGVLRGSPAYYPNINYMIDFIGAQQFVQFA